MVTVEEPGWQDIQEIELPRAPGEGDAIETRYGTCVVTKIDEAAAADRYSGKIFCRLP